MADLGTPTSTVGQPVDGEGPGGAGSNGAGLEGGRATRFCGMIVGTEERERLLVADLRSVFLAKLIESGLYVDGIGSYCCCGNGS